MKGVCSSPIAFCFLPGGAAPENREWTLTNLLLKW
jgi:hypothetical protein